jgi:hypothetical protein
MLTASITYGCDGCLNVKLRTDSRKDFFAMLLLDGKKNKGRPSQPLIFIQIS